MEFQRLSNDVSGNPRYVTHFLNLVNEEEKGIPMPVSNLYEIAVKRANSIGGRKYHTKKFGGGIVFVSYSLPDLEACINQALSQ